MNSYIVKSTLKHNGKTYVKGDTIELTSKFSAPLLKSGVIVNPNKNIDSEEDFDRAAEDSKKKTKEFVAKEAEEIASMDTPGGSSMSINSGTEVAGTIPQTTNDTDDMNGDSTDPSAALI